MPLCLPVTLFSYCQPTDPFPTCAEPEPQFFPAFCVEFRLLCPLFLVALRPLGFGHERREGAAFEPRALKHDPLLFALFGDTLRALPFVPLDIV